MTDFEFNNKYIPVPVTCMVASAMLHSLRTVARLSVTKYILTQNCSLVISDKSIKVEERHKELGTTVSFDKAPQMPLIQDL